MLDSNSVIVNMDAKVSPIVLASILGINISLVYQEAQSGRLPLNITEATYKECIQMYIAHFKKSVELKLAKEQNEQELKLAKLAEDTKIKEEKLRIKEELDRSKASNKRSFSSVGEDDGNDGMPPLMAAKIRQDIRLGVAKEAQLWLRVAIERGQYIAVNELYELTEPFLQAIKNVLVSLASDIPEVQEAVDQGMETLYNLGVKLIEESENDGERFVQRMLEREISPNDIEISFGMEQEI